jgi:hypothetical protein
VPVALAALPLAAQAQSGYLQVGWQRTQAQSAVVRRDSTVGETTFVFSRWIQNYVLNQSLRWREGSDLTWQLGYSDQRAVENDQRVQVPYGHVRLNAPTGGFFVSMRPVTTTSLAQFGSAVPESALTEIVRVRTTQAIASGYFAPRSLPRLDLSWARDHRGPSVLGRSTVGDRRDARLSHAVGALSLRANYGDLARGEKSLAVSPYQRSYGGGAGWGFAPRPSATLQLDYDYTGFRREAGTAATGGVRRTGTDSHRAQLNGAWTASPKLSFSLFSWLQHTGYREAAARRRSDVAEGQLYAMLRPASRISIQTGGQARRVGDGQRGVERIALANATWDGPIRPGWRGLLNASQSWLWNPFRTSYGVSTLRGQTSMRLRQGIDLSADLQATANTDTLANGRAVVQNGATLRLQPLRTIQANLRVTSYRVGSGFDRSVNRSNTGLVDLRWTPVPGLELFGSSGGQRSAGSSRFQSTTRTAYVNWAATARSRFTVNWSRTDFDNPTGLANSLRSRREVVTAQTVLSLDATKQVSAEAGLIDPRTSREAETYTATFTWRFGR